MPGVTQSFEKCLAEDFTGIWVHPNEGGHRSVCGLGNEAREPDTVSVFVVSDIEWNLLL